MLIREYLPAGHCLERAGAGRWLYMWAFELATDVYMQNSLFAQVEEEAASLINIFKIIKNSNILCYALNNLLR